MSAEPRPPVWRMVKEAVEAYGGRTTNVAVRDWILKRYPGTNPGTIGCQIVVCTVNHPSRIHYPENRKPRVATGQYDFLFRPESGQIEWYDSARHGGWEIVEEEDGTLAVRLAGDVSPVVEPKPAASEGAFAAEAHLRDYLANNLCVIEEGLQLFVDEQGSVGVEYVTEVGRIDILANDVRGGLLVIELKVADGPDQVCGQIMRYVGWVKRHLGRGKPVRGLIIARHVSDKIRYALADVPHVAAREYDLSIRLKPVPHVDDLKREPSPSGR